VDDEPLARKRLRRLLQDHPEISVVGEAADGASACRVIEELAPDVVFLDVQMPGLSGFEVLAQLRRRPRIVFVTAYDEFAVRAFEEQALDYLLKPVEVARLARAVERISNLSSPSQEDETRFERLLEAVTRRRTGGRRIAVRSGAKVTLIEPDAIVFCRAEDKYTVLYTADGEHVADLTIEDLEQMLDRELFLRIHRSTIVNLGIVRDLTAVEGGRFLVTLKDSKETQLYASRSGAKALRQRLGF
jgi:two-component system LytT family response regulator